MSKLLSLLIVGLASSLALFYLLALFLPIGASSTYAESSELPMIMACSFLQGMMVGLSLHRRRTSQGYGVAILAALLAIVSAWLYMGFESSDGLILACLTACSASSVGVLAVGFVDAWSTNAHSDIAHVITYVLFAGVTLFGLQELRSLDSKQLREKQVRLLSVVNSLQQDQVALFGGYLRHGDASLLIDPSCNSALSLAGNRDAWQGYSHMLRRGLVDSMQLCWALVDGRVDACDQLEIPEYLNCLRAESLKLIASGRAIPNHLVLP